MSSAGPGDATENGASLPFDDKQRAAVVSELDRILESEAFHTSRRSRQFLSYVVRQTLEGKGELLKERTIGADVFERRPEGITTENSVVRKQAGEVRRRLEQYYKELPEDSPVHILLPVGSYVPEFCFRFESPSDAERSSAVTLEPAPVLPATVEKRVTVPARHIPRWMATAAVLALTALCTGIWAFHRQSTRYPLFARFWEPVSATPESVVVCLAKPVVYIPSREFFRRYASTHGGDLGPEWQRLNQRLPKDLDTPPTWADMRFQEDYGVARGDAYAAFRLAALFSHLGKSSQLRIGDDCSLAELRSAPVTLIGAYNNRWTMEMTSGLHFVFSEEESAVGIREQGSAGKVWEPEWNTNARPSPWSAAVSRQPVTDYALVSRLKNSQTGQYLTIVAGMTSPGTQAAAELVSTPRELDQALRGISPGWENRNLQMVLRVPVPNGITPTTPQVVATYSW